MHESAIADIVLYALLTAAFVLVALELRQRWHRRQDESSSSTSPAVKLHAEAPPAPRAIDSLTPRETQIAFLAAQGLTNRQIGVETGLSINTISNHLKRVYAKLGVSSRTELAWRLQYLDVDADAPPDVDGSPPPEGGL